MARIEPIELWGPFFAFLTANGGGILRDLLRKQHYIICLNGAINAEVSVLWGLIFSLYLDINSYNPDPTGIRNAVIIIAIGAFVTRMSAYYLKVPNIKFRADTVEITNPEALDVQDEIHNIEEQKELKRQKESVEAMQAEIVNRDNEYKATKAPVKQEEPSEPEKPKEEDVGEGPKEPPKL